MDITDPRPPAEADRELTLLHLLQRVWTYALTTKSDDARAYADEIAEGSSRGFLTTIIAPGAPLFGRLWKLTPTGTQFLWDNGYRIAEEEAASYAQTYSAH